MKSFVPTAKQCKRISNYLKRDGYFKQLMTESDVLKIAKTGGKGHVEVPSFVVALGIALSEDVPNLSVVGKKVTLRKAKAVEKETGAYLKMLPPLGADNVFRGSGKRQAQPKEGEVKPAARRGRGRPATSTRSKAGLIVGRVRRSPKVATSAVPATPAIVDQSKNRLAAYAAVGSANLLLGSVEAMFLLRTSLRHSLALIADYDKSAEAASRTSALLQVLRGIESSVESALVEAAQAAHAYAPSTQVGHETEARSASSEDDNAKDVSAEGVPSQEESVQAVVHA